MTLSVFIGIVLAAAAARAADDPSDLVVEALAANPGVAAMEARVRELDRLAEVADLWPDPMAAVEYSNVPTTSWGLGDHPMAGLQLKAQQTVPFPGVLQLRAEVAEARSEGAEASVGEARLQLARAVETAWWRLTLVRQLRVVTEHHVQLTEELVAAVRARYETGATGQHALVRLELLRDDLRDSLLDHDRQEIQLAASLDAALHRGAGAGFDTPRESPIEARPAGATVEGWAQLAAEQRPAFAELDAAEHGAELSASLARRDALPDLTVWAGYRVRTASNETDPGTDLASIGLSVPLTVQSNRAGRGAEAAALEAATRARHQRAALSDQIRADLSAALAAWSRAEQKAGTYAIALLPAAQQALDTTLADYRVGKADFASLYQAEVQLLTLERARLAAVVETHLQLAAVRAITGDALLPAGD